MMTITNTQNFINLLKPKSQWKLFTNRVNKNIHSFSYRRHNNYLTNSIIMYPHKMARSYYTDLRCERYELLQRQNRIWDLDNDIRSYVKGYALNHHVRFFSDNTDKNKSTTNNDSNDEESTSKEDAATPKEQHQVEEKGADETVVEYTVPVPIKCPDLGENKARVARWYKKQGDLVKFGDTLCDIETDLFTFGMDIEDESVGILQEIVVHAPFSDDDDDDDLQTGDTSTGLVKPGDTICIIMHPASENDAKN